MLMNLGSFIALLGWEHRFERLVRITITGGGGGICSSFPHNRYWFDGWFCWYLLVDILQKCYRNFAQVDNTDCM